MRTKSVIADNNQQYFLLADIERILNRANDSFVNAHKNREYRFTDQEICDDFNISHRELDRIKYTQSFEYNINRSSIPR